MTVQTLTPGCQAETYMVAVDTVITVKGILIG
jgi:hypothetical protein